MALRCLLVGLVASLGFELPSGQDVTSWTRLGRDWVAGRTISLADLQAGPPSWLAGGNPASQPPVAPATSVLAAAPASDASAEASPEDLTFAAITDAMASSFAADFESIRAEEVAVVAEQAPTPPAEGLAAIEPACHPELESMALAHADPDPLPSTDAAESAGEPEVSPASRLNSACRATRDAMNAWASLVQAVGREVVAR